MFSVTVCNVLLLNCQHIIVIEMSKMSVYFLLSKW